MELTVTNRSRAYPEGRKWLMKRWRWSSICGFEGTLKKNTSWKGNARVAQWWSIALPRRGPRVRIPSRAFFIARKSLQLRGFSVFLHMLEATRIEDGMKTRRLLGEWTGTSWQDESIKPSLDCRIDSCPCPKPSGTYMKFFHSQVPKWRRKTAFSSSSTSNFLVFSSKKYL